MNLSIASVTVAYNAVRILPRQLHALSRQTRPLQEIIVVDNASTDGTADLMSEKYPQVKVLRLTENLGMAGAWAAGLTYAALEKHHDWVWTFDDDSVPSDDALEAMLGGWRSLDCLKHEVGMLAPMPIHRATGIRYPPLLWHDGFVKPSSDLLEKPVWLADLVITSGCMVRRDVVESIGLPRADFFMDFFDFEYCLRARANGFKIAVVNHATIGHEIGNSRKIHFLGFVRLWTDQPPWREYYISRNLAYTAWWLYPTLGTKLFVLGHLGKHAVGVLLFSSKRVHSLVRMMQGFRDGHGASLGIRFLPGQSA